MPPSVSGNYHEKFERRVIEKLESMGYLISSATYHEVHSEKVKELLQANYSPTGLYLRGRADRIAVRSNMAFEFEIKTHENQKYNDMTIEALPLLHHLCKVRLGVDCLYAFYNPFMQLCVGFWVSTMPPIRVLHIPENTRYNQESVRIIETCGREVFNTDNIVTKPIGWGGSRDPFIIIDKTEVMGMPRLTSIFKELECKED